MRPNLILSRLFAAVSAMLAMVGYVSAEPYSKIRFEPIPSDILPSSEVRKLYHDSDGYIWIPTYNGWHGMTGTEWSLTVCTTFRAWRSIRS